MSIATRIVCDFGMSALGSPACGKLDCMLVRMRRGNPFQMDQYLYPLMSVLVILERPVEPRLGPGKSAHAWLRTPLGLPTAQWMLYVSEILYLLFYAEHG